MLSWALCLAASLWAAPAQRTILIGIVPRVEDVAMVPQGRFTVVDSHGKSQELPSGRRLSLEPAGKGLKLGAWRLPPQASLTPRSESAYLDIGGKRYRGSFLLRLDDSGETVTIVEELGIEDYLLGVLPYEMDPAWPLEALKAQAVVARTFAYTQLGKYSKEGFDLTTDTRSQVYRGLGDESVAIRRAVEGTRGEVLGYKGQILNAYYHSCCGGHTTSASSVWGGEAPPPLRGVADKYCAQAPLYRWSAYVALDQLAASLDKRRLLAGPVQRFEIEQRDSAGYVRSFAARVGGETLRVKAADLRTALGGLLHSLRIHRLRLRGKGVEFEGGGSGHGVGLCQWGARLQAERGRSYERILQFYFPGATLSVIDE